MIQAHPSSSKVATVLRVTSGNFLEMFDFFLFGFYATYISKTFFPVGNEFASLMLTFVTFGAGFLMRPLGAIFLGAYVDSIGRRKGLIACGLIGALGIDLLLAVPGRGGTALLLPLAVMLGLTIGGYAALTQTAAVEMVEPRLAGASIGYNMLMTNTGVMLGPALFGVGLNFGGFAPAWIAVAACLVLGAGLLHRGLVPGIDGAARIEGSGRR